VFRRAQLSGVGALNGPVIALDFDGTLVDCRSRQCATLSIVARELGTEPPNLDRWWRLKRSGFDTISALCQLGVDLTQAAAMGHRWAEQVESDQLLALDRPLPGCRSSLRALHAAGFRIVVLSARQRPAALINEIRALDMRELIDDVIIVDPTHASREKSDALCRIGSSTFVGDTESDARAADCAGVRFLAVSTGQRSRRYLQRYVVNTIYKSLSLALADVLANQLLANQSRTVD
jgi:phosphoglycolate phosphatase-like HAD superfamily hydrolase